MKSGAHAVIVARENRSGSGDVRARIEHIVPGQTQGLHVAGVDLAKAEINRVTLADIVTSERHRLLTACRDDLATETVDVDSPFEAFAFRLNVSRNRCWIHNRRALLCPTPVAPG